MKPFSPLIKDSLLVFMVFSLTTFITFASANVSGGFLQSSPYKNRDVIADQKLNTLTDGQGSKILDGIVSKVQTKAQEMAGNPVDAKAYNAFINNYLSTVDTLDNTVRKQLGSDYDFIFKYLYPRVYELRMEESSSLLSIFNNLGTAVNSTTNNPSINTNRSVTVLNTSSDLINNSVEEDLCAQEGLDNIDETNFSITKNVFIKGNGWGQWSGMGDYDPRDRAYKMDAGQSYSFPMDIPDNAASLNGWRIVFDPYGWTFTHIWKVSEKKCDFSLSKNHDPCNGVASGGQNQQPMFATNGKESSYCQLIPGKKYYLNFRWMRKSDIIDASGKLKMNTFNRTNLSSMPVAELNKFFDENFNTQGDSCLPGKHPWQWGPDDSFPCMISPHWESGFSSMLKLSPQDQAKGTALVEKKATKDWEEKLDYYKKQDEEKAAAEANPPPRNPICDDPRYSGRSVCQ